MTMFFTDTGEFWMLHGSVIAAHRSTLTKGSPDARAVVAVAAQNDGSNGPFSRAKDPPRRAGLFGVKDLQWYSNGKVIGHPPGEMTLE